LPTGRWAPLIGDVPAAVNQHSVTANRV